MSCTSHSCLPDAVSRLLQAVCFREEWSHENDKCSNNDNLLDLHRAAAQRTKFLPCEVCNVPAVSVAVDESDQGDTARLPLGARTLILRASDGAILMRGVNKFVDIRDGEVAALLSDADVRRFIEPVCLQRKMAGYVVVVRGMTLTDGRHQLVVASKHSLIGRHCEHGTCLLQEKLKVRGHSTEDLAKVLCEKEMCLLAEVVDTAFDPGHPVLDTAFSPDVHFFAAQSATSRRECILPIADLQRVLEMFGLTCVPNVKERDFDWAMYDTTVQQCTRDWGHCPFSSGLGEGYVALFRVASDVMAQFLGQQQGVVAESFMFRVKIKTARYITWRAARTLKELAQTQPASVAASYHTQPLYLQLYVQEHVTTSLNNANKNKGSDEETASHDASMRLFEEQLQSKSTSEYEAAINSALQHVAQSVGMSCRTPIIFVVPVGIPGCGKSTVTNAFVEAIAGSAVANIAVISRDDINASVSARLADPVQARRKLHNVVVGYLREVAADTTSFSQHPRVVVLDACNASVEGRKLWIRTLKPSCVVMVNFKADVEQDDVRETVLRRIYTRGAHPTLSGDVAETAVPEIAKILQPATAEEADCLVDVDAVRGGDVASVAKPVIDAVVAAVQNKASASSRSSGAAGVVRRYTEAPALDDVIIGHDVVSILRNYSRVLYVGVFPPAGTGWADILGVCFEVRRHFTTVPPDDDGATREATTEWPFGDKLVAPSCDSVAECFGRDTPPAAELAAAFNVHLTSFFVSPRSPNDVLFSWLQQCGRTAKINVRSIVMDARCCYLDVESVVVVGEDGGEARVLADTLEQPLHVTVALGPGISPRYCFFLKRDLMTSLMEEDQQRATAGEEVQLPNNNKKHNNNQTEAKHSRREGARRRDDRENNTDSAAPRARKPRKIVRVDFVEPLVLSGVVQSHLAQ